MTAILQRESSGGRIQIDAVPTYTVGALSEITAHPIERGSPITDHRQKLQTPVMMRCRATETPLADALYDLPTGPARIAAYIDWLDATGAELVTLMTPNRPTIRGLMIKSYPQSFDVTAGMDFTIELVQVVIVDTQEVSVEAMKAPKAEVAAGAATEGDHGDGSGTEVPENKSALLRLLGQ